ncbi:hypothetical protein EEL33_04325 [Muribaculaceae bacterium Isolate-037 (Harlan)]|nr:hypothetical protein EEL33_04325 [Muribaculaceae bacterium Isolate-037 (Harlan)]
MTSLNQTFIMKAFIISFGDSDKYSVHFDGSLEEFEKSSEFKRIKDAVYDYVKEKLPAAKCEAVLTPHVEEPEGSEWGYPGLDTINLEKLKKDALRQIQVKMSSTKLDSNAAFSA